MRGTLLICESKVYPGVDLCRSCTYRQVLIELGPSYFKYMESTANNPTVLAKLLGFYTIEIRNVESGTVQAKADLLVMENLFFGKKIVKTFDLKGIQGRKVKATTSGTSTKPLFDGDWIEGVIV
jgi:1-phosphatidylinositol-3-phosphate 5-kinase